jgi:hypothetical protein
MDDGSCSMMLVTTNDSLKASWMRSTEVRGEKALSWSNLLFDVRANVQRDHSMVVFLEPDVQWIVSNRHGSVSLLRVHSRHPGRYPKLESSTLSYPAFEPLTERHAFLRACSTSHRNVDAHGVRLTLSVCWKHDNPSRASSFGRF